MSLALVIPVRNDWTNLGPLLEQVADRAIAEQVVVVDDGSAPPVDRARIEAALSGIPAVLIRSEAAKGAGHARNLGLQAVETDEVLFFDADDLFLDDFPALRRALAGRPFDMAVFAHDDSRRLNAGQRGPDESLDRAIWAELGPAGAPRPLPLPDATSLVRVSNYPWNKIIKTGFAHRIGLHFTEIPVHNDIESHWSAFLEAGTILASPIPAVVHRVHEAGTRLTNRRGADRMQVFQALEAVVRRLDAVSAAEPGKAAYAGALLDFILRLLAWIETTQDGESAVAALRARAAGFLTHWARHCSPGVASALEEALAAEPGLAARFCAFHEKSRP